MTRLDRKIKELELTSPAEKSGWRKGNVNQHQRTINFYKDASYISIRFSRWLYDISEIWWWDSSTHRMNIFNRQDGDFLLADLLSDIFKGRVDPTNLYILRHYRLY